MAMNSRMFEILLFIMLLSPTTINSSFQYLQMVHQWPNGFCSVNVCKRNPLPNNFTIHGLWPNNFTRTLEYCVTGRSATYTMLFTSDMLRRDSVWPNLKEPKPSQSFWSHEWKKHGTCSLNMYSQNAYFNLAMRLKNDLYILNILRNNGINPPTITTLREVNSTIFRAIGKIPDVKCTHNRELEEISICYEVSGKTPIDCPATINVVSKVKPITSYTRSGTCLGGTDIFFR